MAGDIFLKRDYTEVGGTATCLRGRTWKDKQGVQKTQLLINLPLRAIDALGLTPGDVIGITLRNLHFRKEISRRAPKNLATYQKRVREALLRLKAAEEVKKNVLKEEMKELDQSKPWFTENPADKILDLLSGEKPPEITGLIAAVEEAGILSQVTGPTCDAGLSDDSVDTVTDIKSPLIKEIIEGPTIEKDEYCVCGHLGTEHYPDTQRYCKHDCTCTRFTKAEKENV